MSIERKVFADGDGDEASLVACVCCEKMFCVPAPASKIQDFIENRLQRPFVQDVFPNLSADHRELILSGTCGSCFDDLMEGRIVNQPHTILLDDDDD